MTSAESQAHRTPAASTGESRRQRLAVALLFVTPALWSFNYLVARWSPGQAAPHTLAFGRWALAALLLGAFTAPELWRHRAWMRAHWAHLVTLGALGMWICGAWVYIAARTTSATNIALIYAASPVVIVLLSVLWLGERLRLRQALGVAIAMAGVLHVVLRGHWRDIASVHWVVGDLWIVAATAAWSLYTLLQRRWASPMSAAATLCATALGGLVVLLPFALWEQWQGSEPTTGFGYGLMVLGAVIPGALAFWAYAFIQRQLGVSRAAVQLYLGPLYGGAMAWAVLGEPVGWHHAVGAALILPGVWLVSRR